jgi:hypothetical protein
MEELTKAQTAEGEKLIRFKTVSDVLERYQDFVNEVLRLSLLGIAGIGFLITTFIQKSDTASLTSGLTTSSKLFLSFALVLFGAAAAVSLGSRLLIAESIAYHFSAIIWKEDDPAKAASHGETRYKRYSASRRTMIWSAIALGMGAVCLAISFIITICASNVQPKTLIHLFY